MKNLMLIFLFFPWLLFATPQSWQLHSPDKQITITLTLDETRFAYAVNFQQKPVLRSSALGMAFKNQPSLQNNLELVSSATRNHQQTWQPFWGQRAEITDHFNELQLTLREKSATPREMTVFFRAYNDGIAFRYHFPAQPHLKDVVISNELTEFAFAQNFSAWWIPAYRDQRFEYQFLNSALSSVDVAHTPITLLNKDVAIAIHEAALLNYASMTLRNIADNHITFTADLVPWANGDKVYTKTPFQTPWRMIQIAESELALLDSDLMLNLNEPMPENTDTSYIETGKYMGIWWEMHIGEKDWSPGPLQGATTERAIEYIDFAAKHDIMGILVEGWNTGWEGEWWQRKPTFNFTTPVAGFDIEKVSAYAQERGLRLIGHHETAAGIAHYEAQMEAAFAYYQKLGVRSVKMGYVGTRLDQHEWHHGQFMVNHYQQVTELAAKYQITLNGHETVKDTGLSRTFPNLMTREVVRGMEYNGGSPDTGNLPNHTVIIPFTRGLAGPIDFTPGIFNFAYQKNRPNNRVPSTLANQLALYVTLYSPLQMAADLPENYEKHPAFQFIDDVPTDWQQSKAIAGKIAEYLVVARQDRHSKDWYLGATTNEQSREIEVKLDFLNSDIQYRAKLYIDGEDADWETNPMSYRIEEREVSASDIIKISLKAGGGAAIQFKALN
jgi:alpha-glucosidase